MLKRIVRMEFDPMQVDTFMALFEEVKEKISNQDGCHHVEVCRDSIEKNVCYTFSLWENESFLEDYRSSTFFKETWARTKVLFNGKPMAFSLVELD